MDFTPSTPIMEVSSESVELTTHKLSSTWNSTAPLNNLPLDSNFAWLLCALFLAMSWAVYITYYNSRIIGFILTKVLNRFITNAYIKIGSFSLSVLSGKIMFRDVAYITTDYTIRAQDGWLIFRWWRPYVRKEFPRTYTDADTRVSLLLNGFELHVYNRSHLYAHLEQLFGLEPSVLPCGKDQYWQDSGETDNKSGADSEASARGIYEWRDLIPVIKAQISTGRFVFGNRLLPTTMSINFEEAFITYKTRPASSSLDLFQHIVECKAESFKVMLAPSPKYIGIPDEPPRYMGEGFVVVQSNQVDFFYYQDEPGVVPAEPEVVQLANGDLVQRSTAPCWGLDIKCGKGTDFSYGPWADRQREQLYKFFYPQDYQVLQITKQPKIGEKRNFESFDIRLSTTADATFDILFSKEKETNAIHMTVKQGSYLEITIPWVITEKGYSSRITGQLFHLDASTSLQYRTLLESEILGFDVQTHYPRIWNGHQDWICNLTGCRATVTLIHAHKGFFQALIEDWASKARPDILHFVPYTWHFNLILTEFELITLSNEYNWIDCSSQHQENACIAFCGDIFDLSFDLPFVDFLPPQVSLKFWIQGESVSMFMYLPESNPHRNMVLMLEKNSRLTNRDGSLRESTNNEKKWHKVVQKDIGWIECCSVPIVALSLKYTYQPVPALDSHFIDFDITTPEKEELLLSPIRPNGYVRNKCQVSPEDFDPSSMTPDVLQLELEIGPSVLALHGTLLNMFIQLKENYFGAYQEYIEFDSPPQGAPEKAEEKKPSEKLAEPEEFDPRCHRPLDVVVSVIIHDIHGHLMKNCSPKDPPCPSLYLERLNFELHKGYRETKLQLLLSPIIMISTDTVERAQNHNHLNEGHVVLSSLQVRGHAMFSNVGRPLTSETLEYAWLVEVQAGDVTGKITVPQLYNVILGLETFVHQVVQSDSCLQSPRAYRYCQHDLPQVSCSESSTEILCPVPDDVKYRMTRVFLDVVDICIVEANTAICLEVYPIKMAMCNLHNNQMHSGMSLLISCINISQYAMPGTTYSGCSQNPQCDLWVKVGEIELGPVYVDSSSLVPGQDKALAQEAFLKIHDTKTKRLWFLWPNDIEPSLQKRATNCGCLGGCLFFSSNNTEIRFFELLQSENDRFSAGAARLAVVDEDPKFGESILVNNIIFTENISPPGTPEISNSYPVPELFTSHHSPGTPEISPGRRFEKDENELCRGAHQNSFRSKQTTWDNSNLVTVEEAYEGENKVVKRRRVLRQYSSPTHAVGHKPGHASQSVTFARSTSVANSADSFDSLTKKRDSLLADDAVIHSTQVEAENKASPNLTSQRRGSKVSLNGGMPGDSVHHVAAVATATSAKGCSPRSVRRATSTESTHSSEAFFSADEDALSVGGAPDTTEEVTPEAERRRHSSGVKTSSSTSSSLDRRKASTGLRTSQISEQDRDAVVMNNPDADSNSVSSTSFISAMSSQEDITLVNLHNQMDKPIMDSPLLISCYTSHLSQYHCNQWDEPPPLPHIIQRTHEGPANSSLFLRATSHWKPKFISFTDGFSTIRMIAKKGTWGHKRRCPFSVNDFMQKDTEAREDGKGTEKETVFELCTLKTTVVVQLRGDIHIMISPLMLENLKSFIDSVTPTLATLHPVAIISHLMVSCTQKVENHNQLKKEKVEYLGRLKEEAQKTVFQHSDRAKSTNSPESAISSNSYEETRVDQIQMFVQISKVNVMIMQCSIVEEIISFSALDNLKDLTCVSVLAVCLEKMHLQLFHSHQSKRTIQTFTDHSLLDGGYRPVANEHSSKKTKTDSVPVDPIMVETSETCQEESVLTFTISAVHVQLRRLKNSSSILKEATLTVVSPHHSKVCFTFERIPLNLCSAGEKQTVFSQDWEKLRDEEKMGFIMFECGLEDISLKFVRKKGFGFNKEEGEGELEDEVEAVPKPSENGDSIPAPAPGERSPSKLSHHSARSEVSLDSKISFPSCISECGSNGTSLDDKKHLQNLEDSNGDASMFMIELKTTWFNFAAPPRTPNTHKIDFTRLDWHLLSTMTPSINAWLKPSDRFLVSFRKMKREMQRRTCGVMGCLMAEAIDIQSVHMPVKSKYTSSKLTPLAKTIQEDPSCQLLAALMRYIMINDLEVIEESLKPEYIPPVKTLYRGIMALSRQWKNVLYMPLLVEQNIRLRKNARPLNVTFSVPLAENLKNQEDMERNSLEECEVTDETTNLLMAEGGLVGTTSETSKDMKKSVSQQNIVEDMVARKNSKNQSAPQQSSRNSVAFPLLGGPLDSPLHYGGMLYLGKTLEHGISCMVANSTRLKREDSHHSLKSATWSFSSIEPILPQSNHGTPKRSTLDPTTQGEEEDLYNWMARQQDFMKGGVSQSFTDQDVESKLNTLTSDNSGDNNYDHFPHLITMAPFGVQLADAHLIFQPLLISLNIPSHAGRASFVGKFGPRVSVSGIVELLKIDIVESEYHDGFHKKRTSTKSSSPHNKLFIDTSMDTPAFICDKFVIEMDIRETKGIQNIENKSSDSEKKMTQPTVLFASDGLQRTTTMVNFNTTVQYMAQQVNLPLLRLLHQFCTMYENVKETRLELKANRVSSFKESLKENKVVVASESNTLDFNTQTPKYNTLTRTQTSNLTPSKLSSGGGVSSLATNIKMSHTLPQRIRASTKGYVNLQDSCREDGMSSPLSMALSDSVAVDVPDGSAPPSEDLIVEEKVDLTPRCWKTMCFLLDLYEMMPPSKALADRFTVSVVTEQKSDVSEGYKGNGKYEPLREHRIDMEEAETPVEVDSGGVKKRTIPRPGQKEHLKNLANAIVVAEWVPVVVFGVAQVKRIRLLAMLSGLRLESELSGFHASLTHKESVREMVRQSESSLTGQLGHASVILLEGSPPNHQMVVKMMAGKSQALYSTQSKKGKSKNSALLTIGPINIDIPQHPVVLHGMMTRSSKQLSTTLQELRYSRQPIRSSHQLDELNAAFITHSPQISRDHTTQLNATDSGTELIKPIVVQFSVILDSLTIGAALLPSLRAQYQMGQVTSMGVTGSKAKFTIDLPQHSISFNTKVPTSEANLPSRASVDLPPVHISAEYIQDSSSAAANTTKQDSFTDGIVLRQGSYLNALAEIGTFEHSLTTDLLNHLVLVQKVFMKEVNEVVQKMSGADKPIRLWSDSDKGQSLRGRRLLFSLQLRLKGIQITATTPTSSAVRLETGVVDLQLSNRVQNMSTSGSHSCNTMKLFGKGQVDLNLALGQLIKNALFDEAEAEFQQFAFFKTRICLRNALQDEMISSQYEDKEAVLITMNRPLIYFQPIALDKAVLVWLNYKNAYEYWNEQRGNLNKEVLTATQQVFEKVPQFTQLSTQALGTLFLQLTVDDMGICMPINKGTLVNSKLYDVDATAAVVVTLENTRISACSCGSLVSKARFTGLCLRFADDFEVSLDDWKPDPSDSSIMNLCVVSEGTYEICSRTIAAQGNNNAKWILNVQWQMEGVDIHVDVNISKALSALFKTLTALTGEEDEGDGIDLEEIHMDHSGVQSRNIQEPVVLRKGSVLNDALPPFFLDPKLDAKKRSRLIEKEMNEQAKIISDLRFLGASQSTIEQEEKRLKELEAAVFNDFRRDVIKKLRRQSVKQATSIKDKFGLGSHPTPIQKPSLSIFFPDEQQHHSLPKATPDSKESSPANSHTRTASLDMSDLPQMGLTERPSMHRMEVLKPGHSTPGGGSSGVSSFKQSTPEPSIDFELDIKVFFNSGKCVLHTKDSSKEEDNSKSNRSMKKERSFSGGLMDAGSPTHVRRRSGPRSNLSSSRLRFVPTPAAGQIADFTIFLIPGLDVKIHYSSWTVTGESPVGSCPKQGTEVEVYDATKGGYVSLDSSIICGGGARKSTTKKASLFAWITLQSIPEETVISPHILDFLEQALEVIPIQSSKSTPPPAQGDPGSGLVFSNLKPEAAGGSSFVAPGQYVNASFPVDVIVYFRMQPSILRFSCLPVSRVECLLRLPSVDLVFSSKRAEDEVSSTTQGEALFLQKPKVSGRVRNESGQRSVPEAMVHHPEIGGLSATGCLADFSLYIFHPYGGAKKHGGKFRSSGKENETSPLASSERKDSLSLQVEFVKVNISRSRRMNLASHFAEGLALGRTGKSVDPGGAVIRFSAVIDVGSASFKYDMRRLTEILAFPKAWYRRSIARRMFLGDPVTGALFSDQEDSVETSSSSGTLSPSGSKADNFPFSRMELGPPSDTEMSLSQSLNDVSSAGKKDKEDRGQQSPVKEEETVVTKKTDSDTERHIMPPNSLPIRERMVQHPSSLLPPNKQGNNWETLVLFAFNLSKLNIHMNMGNVMGNTSWLTQGFKSQGRLSIDSTGHKDLSVSIGLDGSGLDAKGGIVGGSVELSQIDTHMSLKENWGQEPNHTITVKLWAAESRLDYMGTSVLMARVSALDIKLKDEWRVSPESTGGTLGNHPTKRPAVIFIHGNLSWDQLQLLISKSTTPDLVKMHVKLEEFFSQQFHSSKRVFSSLQPRLSRHSMKNRSQRRQRQSDAAAAELEGRHHRHWQKALSMVSVLQLSTLPLPLPCHGTIVGGTMELQGNNISLACFHGISFRSKAWAIFSLREPNISFATEAQDIVSTKSVDTHIVMNLTFRLGHNVAEHAQHSSMATVCRISRNVLFPPQFRSINEWFHYAFATSELDDVGRFPSLDPERDSSSPGDRKTSVPKGPEVNHTNEMIFAFPSLELHLKTEHFQSEDSPAIEDAKPVVECSFVTEFDDHIFVAVDAEAFFFLHDLIVSYIKEKDNGIVKNQSPDSERKRKLADPTESLQKDWRDYACYTWHLEPTVRLLSWAGKGIEPYGVDYILQKLGFSHARVTIPKWMQRGCMDPLDKFLSVMMEKMIKAVREDKG